MHSRHRKHAPARTAGPNGPAQSAVSSGDEHHKAPTVSEEDIRIRAYKKWEMAGKPAGDGVQFWLEAEQELGVG